MSLSLLTPTLANHSGPRDLLPQVMMINFSSCVAHHYHYHEQRYSTVQPISLKHVLLVFVHGYPQGSHEEAQPYRKEEPIHISASDQIKEEKVVLHAIVKIQLVIMEKISTPKQY